MAAHIIKRADCGGTWYLVDGNLVKSLKTKAKRYAEVLLRQYEAKNLVSRRFPLSANFTKSGSKPKLSR